jgi:hypothetical protein
VGTEISHSMTDSDCTRFLRARPESPLKAAEMAQKWFVWRSTLMTPLPPCQLAYSPNIMLANPHPPENNPHINLIKGESKLFLIVLSARFVILISPKCLVSGALRLRPRWPASVLGKNGHDAMQLRRDIQILYD